MASKKKTVKKKTAARRESGPCCNAVAYAREAKISMDVLWTSMFLVAYDSLDLKFSKDDAPPDVKDSEEAAKLVGKLLSRGVDRVCRSGPPPEWMTHIASKGMVIDALQRSDSMFKVDRG